MFEFFSFCIVVTIAYFVYRPRVHRWWEHRQFMQTMKRPVITVCSRESVLGIGPYHLRRTAVDKETRHAKTLMKMASKGNKALKVPYEALTVCGQKLFGGTDLRIVDHPEIYKIWATADHRDPNEPDICKGCLEELMDEFMVFDPDRDKFPKAA